ncbi:hypothetical protein [Rhodobaculum claviforme]|uniref:Uncharacterized protein n=1 Tax=Rhodobaculum claviforme TaxID=1549854 RepID=A0A934WKG5_9RHOB|nr:hypothetical protein [Rhodobaculum claviforme]MBK5928844.1 hypothetical protein [Rhodobaculum claviforme]
MDRHLTSRLAGGVLLCAATVAAPVAANELSSPVLTFGLDQRFETSRNRGLTIPSEGTTTQSVTSLSFGLVSETLVQRLSLTGGTAYRLGRAPEENRLSVLDNSRLSLSYLREGVDSEFSVTASARRARQEFLGIEDFIDDEGLLELPEDFDDLTRFGRRTAYDVDTRLVLGREAAPFGVTFSLGATAIDYSDGAPQEDIRTVRGAIDTRFRLSPVLTTTLGARREERREGSDPTELRVTDAVTAGVIYALSPRTQVAATLGYSRVDRTGSIQRREQGLIGGFDVTTDTPLGPVGLSLDTEVLEAGQRVSAVVRRSLDLPMGTLSGSLGAARDPGGEVGAIGTLAYAQPLRTGNFTVNLSRIPVGNDDPRTRTALSIGLTHDINSVSGIALRADHAETTGTATRNPIERTTISASYRHQLTPDWALNSGVSYRVRREGALGSARSPEIFVGLGRDWAWPL